VHRLATAIIALGGVGLAAAVLGAALVMPQLARLDEVLGRSDDALATAATAARRASDAFDGFDASLDDAVAAAGEAAGLASRSATTARGLAAAMQLTILGTQPLIGLAGSFEQSAQDLEGLGGSLATMGAALGRNRSDLAALETQMRRLADDLATLAQPARVPAIMPIGVGLLLLLALQSAGVMLVGLALRRGMAASPSV
jgi:hypothetical protein